MNEDAKTDPLRGSVLVAFGRDHFFMFAELPDDTARGRIVSAVLEGLKTGEAPTVKDLAERLLAADLVNDAMKNARKWASKSHPGKAGAPDGNDNARKDKIETIEKQSENNRESINAAGIELNGSELNGSEEENAFAAFWEAWPKKVAKVDARKAWAAAWKNRKIGPGNLSAVLAAVRRGAVSDGWIKDGGQFCPYPGKWIRGEQWADEVRGAAPAFQSQQRPMMKPARDDW